jgi:[acyl-carrier-protein] S-malonyltransferase
MFNGPEDELRLTRNTQPALLTHSIALWSLMQDKITPAFFAGHSLGEYTALVAAGGISFEDAVKAVHNRGIYMQEAVPVGTGGMLAVLGADDATVEAVCKEVSRDGSVVEPANYNSAGQVVVAGHMDALERFTPIMKERGAKRILPLPVSAPFHSSLMKPAQDRMAHYLAEVKISPLGTPVVNNVDVAVENEPSVILDSLVRQVTGAVKWSQLVKKLVSVGVTRFIEVGHGAVLTGLVKKIGADVEAINISSAEDIEKKLI